PARGPAPGAVRCAAKARLPRPASPKSWARGAVGIGDFHARAYLSGTRKGARTMGSAALEWRLSRPPTPAKTPLKRGTPHDAAVWCGVRNGFLYVIMPYAQGAGVRATLEERWRSRMICGASTELVRARLAARLHR